MQVLRTPRKEIPCLFVQPVSVLNHSHHGGIASLYITGILIVAPCCWKSFHLSFHCAYPTESGAVFSITQF